MHFHIILKNIIMNYRNLNGFKVYGFDDINQILSFISNKKKILIAMNAEKIINENKVIKKMSKNHIAYPDGEGCVLGLKQKGLRSIKISGSKLWLEIINHYKSDFKFYFIGATEEVIGLTISKLKKDYVGINIVGHRDGYFSEKEMVDLKKSINNEKPDFIFVAMGSPKQEILMNKLYDHYPSMYMGLGGSFDVYVGKKKHVSKLFYNLKLEWLFRLFQDLQRFRRVHKLFIYSFKLLFRRL